MRFFFQVFFFLCQMGAQSKWYCSPDFRSCHLFALPSLHQPRGPWAQRGTVMTCYSVLWQLLWALSWDHKNSGEDVVSASYAVITLKALNLARPFHPWYKALTFPTVFNERDGRRQEPCAQYPCPEQLIGGDSQWPPVHSKGIAGGFCGVKHFRCCEIQKKESLPCCNLEWKWATQNAWSMPQRASLLFCLRHKLA